MRGCLTRVLTGPWLALRRPPSVILAQTRLDTCGAAAIARQPGAAIARGSRFTFSKNTPTTTKGRSR